MISINLFCCSEKVFILMSIYMIGTILMKQHYLKKKRILEQLEYGRYYRSRSLVCEKSL